MGGAAHCPSLLQASLPLPLTHYQIRKKVTVFCYSIDSMSQSLAQNAIALLIDLAEQGEIDPWDVQVIDVIDRFLSNLTLAPQAGTDRAVYESSLSESGQAFLYASMLVLLKADSLARADEPVTPDALDEQELMEVGEMLAALPPSLERTLQRRAVAQPPQQRRVTLQELIDQLKLIETAIEQQPTRTRARQPRPHPRSQAIRTIAQLAHQENLLDTVAALEHFLTDHWDELAQGQDWLEFETLVKHWGQWQGAPGAIKPWDNEAAENHHDHSEMGDRVSIFWALLFLSAQSKVELLQEEFYQELKVRTLVSDVVQALPE